MKPANQGRHDIPGLRLEAAAAKQAAQGSNPWEEVLADAADEEERLAGAEGSE